MGLRLGRCIGGSNRRGQFIPLSLTVLFVAVMFMMVVIDIYRVTMAKLKVQNLADAVALNVASKEAQSMNKVPDLNEWMNRQYADQNVNVDPTASTPPPCPSGNSRLPRLDCSDPSHYTFQSKAGAQAYARLVANMNNAQMLFATAYNKMIGAKGGGGAASLDTLLRTDIPDLNDPSIWYSVTNQHAQAPAPPINPGSAAPNIDNAELKFKATNAILKYKNALIGTSQGSMQTLAGLPSGGTYVGAMTIDAFPKIGALVGAKAIVVKYVDMGFGKLEPVRGDAFACVVPGSGLISDTSSGSRPRFRPTYYVELRN
jgi:hypothetical protein